MPSYDASAPNPLDVSPPPRPVGPKHHETSELGPEQGGIEQTRPADARCHTNHDTRAASLEGTQDELASRTERFAEPHERGIREMRVRNQRVLGGPRTATSRASAETCVHGPGASVCKSPPSSSSIV